MPFFQNTARRTIGGLTTSFPDSKEIKVKKDSEF